VVLCALILGPVLTTLPLREYFSDPLFARYFLNVLGIIQYELPGLFGGGPVNLQLWTVPFELECYIALAILALFKIPQRRLAFTLIVCALTVALTVENLIHTPWPLNFRAPGRMLVLSFLFGVTIYLWRDRLAAGPVVVLSAGVASWAALTSAETLFIASAPVAYFTVLVGIQNWRRVFVIKGADYSYGIYLYGFPIQMTIKELFPSANSWTFNVVASVPIAALFAYVSWTYLEARVVESKGAILAKVAKLEALMKSLKRSRASSLVGQSALPDTRDIGAPSDAPRPPHLP
jgi:peptidoglycan/LPS O-acetylase OafA/YrhL